MTDEINTNMKYKESTLSMCFKNKCMLNLLIYLFLHWLGKQWIGRIKHFKMNSNVSLALKHYTYSITILFICQEILKNLDLLS